MATTTTSTEDRALSLLGQGLGPEIVAAAVGVSTSRISQLLSTAEFAGRVAELRYENLAKHNTRDNAYDAMEDSLLEKLKDCLPFMMRPMEILKAIQVINAAKTPWIICARIYHIPTNCSTTRHANTNSPIIHN